MLSRFEEDILEILCEDARTKVADIAAMLKKDEAAVRTAISKMEKEKIILQYRPVVDWEKADMEQVTALIEVRVTPQHESGFDAMAEKIYRYSEVKSVYLMSGGFDLMIMVEGRTMKEVALFVSEKLSALENITATATHFVLKKYKHDGIVMGQKNSDDRLAVLL